MIRLGTTPIPSPINTNPPDLSWLGPTITAGGAVVVGLIALFSILWSNRQKHKDTMVEKATDQQPTITDGWDEVRKARAEATTYYNLYRTFEDLFYRVWGALRHLVRTTRDVHPDQKFDPDVVDALAIVPPDTTDVK
jgi:hypothetical protein